MFSTKENLINTPLDQPITASMVDGGIGTTEYDKIQIFDFFFFSPGEFSEYQTGDLLEAIKRHTF